MADQLCGDRTGKDEFQTLAYLIVHNLKEPTRAIRTGVELLLEAGHAGTLGDESGELPISSCADRILRGASRFDDLAGSIAQYADDLNSEDEPLASTNAEAALRSVRQKLGKLIAELNATISNGPLPTLDCQPSRFARLLEGLVRNAILYHREEPPVIHVAAVLTNETWLFSVTDNGTGISPADLNLIFEPLSRLKSAGYRGLGMGLTTCKRIVTHQGGRIWMESQLGIGSKVCFTLPQ